MDGVGDELLLELAQKIGYASNVRILAVKLGFELSDTDTFVETNKLNGTVTTEGTLQMLRRWRDKTPTSNQRNVLKTALENAQLSELADIYFNQSRTNGGQREENTRKRFRSELSHTTEEKDAILTEEVRAYDEIRIVPDDLPANFEIEIERFVVDIDGWDGEDIDALIKILERRYTDPCRILILRGKDFRPSLRRQNGHHDSSTSPFENSRHDIFTAELARKQLRRIAVSYHSPGESTALCHSLANDWATQNRSSRLSKMQFLFELACSKINPNQTIEAAIKDQLFSEFDQIDETLIKELLVKMPGGITILLDGFNGRDYGKDMKNVLTGRTLREVTVMVTAEPRYTSLLNLMAPGVYDHIDMY